MDLLAHWEQQPQRQDALDDQLRDVRTIANRMGCYDAADWIRARTLYEDAPPQPRGAVDALCYIAMRPHADGTHPAQKARDALAAMGVEPTTSGGQ
jgi:hypothetical protein